MSDDILLFPNASGVDETLIAAVEAVLFAAGSVLRIEKLAGALPAYEPRRIREALGVLEERTSASDRGVEVVRVAGGWQLRTDERFADAVKHVVTSKPVRLSNAAMEVLAVITWEQPATKGDVDKVRGVDSGGTLRKLLNLGLVRVSGRRAVPGRPLEYRTTKAFLELFSLPDLRALPTLSDAEELGDG